MMFIHDIFNSNPFNSNPLSGFHGMGGMSAQQSQLANEQMISAMRDMQSRCLSHTVRTGFYPNLEIKEEANKRSIDIAIERDIDEIEKAL